jgi:hypothetical protein
MDLSLYQKMIGASSLPEAYKNHTISYVNELFQTSPSLKQITINGIPYDAILSRTNKSTELEILLRPLSVANKGAYVVIDSDTYLITDFIANEIYPKGKIELCNSSLKWKDDLGNVYEYKCIVKGESFQEENDKKVITSDSQLIVLIQYNNDTKKIKPNQRFIFGEYAYDVVSIDSLSNVYNNQGFIKLELQFTSTSSTDDKTNGIADNSGNSSWGAW